MYDVMTERSCLKKRQHASPIYVILKSNSLLVVDRKVLHAAYQWILEAALKLFSTGTRLKHPGIFRLLELS
jgi:hypothetical protein